MRGFVRAADKNGRYNVAPRTRAAVIHRDNETGGGMIEEMYVFVVRPVVSSGSWTGELIEPKAMGADPSLDQTSPLRSAKHY